MVALSNSLFVDFFGKNHTPNGCVVACLEIGTSSQLITHIFPERTFDVQQNPNSQAVTNWYSEQCQAKEVGFVNTHDKPLTLYWVSSTGKRHNQGHILPGERNTFWTQTFLGHIFEVEDDESSVVLVRLKVKHDTFYSIGGVRYGLEPNFVPQGYPDLKSAVAQTFDGEWYRHNTVRRSFTELGFAKGRLPRDLFQSISTYYYNNREHHMREEWGSKGLFVNWWEQDSRLISMPFKLKVILYICVYIMSLSLCLPPHDLRLFYIRNSGNAA